MNTSEWIVLFAGVASIAWVNWYFFLADRGTAVAVAAGGMNDTAAHAQPLDVTITVKGGYSPGTIRTRAGAPVRLVFDRQETSSCSEEVVFPDFGIRKFLPPFQQTIIELTPSKPGKYEFTCGMSMLRGTLLVE